LTTVRLSSVVVRKQSRTGFDKQLLSGNSGEVEAVNLLPSYRSLLVLTAHNKIRWIFIGPPSVLSHVFHYG
jgi:hypothetical protein